MPLEPGVLIGELPPDWNRVALRFREKPGQMLQTDKGTWTRTHMDLGGSGAEVLEGASGKFFMTDLNSPDVILRKGVKLWARQMNCEHARHVQVTNGGSDTWIFGLKTEHSVTALHALNGGRTELVSMLFPSQGKAGQEIPGLLVEDSQVRDMVVTGRNIYEVFVRQTKDSKTKEIPNSSGIVRGSNKAIVPWYVSAH